MESWPRCTHQVPRVNWLKDSINDHKNTKYLRGQNFVNVVVIRVFRNIWSLLPQYAWKIIEKNIETYLGPNMTTLAFIWLHLITCWDTANIGNNVLKPIVHFFSYFRPVSGTFFCPRLCQIGQIAPFLNSKCTWLLLEDFAKLAEVKQCALRAQKCQKPRRVTNFFQNFSLSYKLGTCEITFWFI